MPTVSRPPVPRLAHETITPTLSTRPSTPTARSPGISPGLPSGGSRSFAPPHAGAPMSTPLRTNMPGGGKGGGGHRHHRGGGYSSGAWDYDEAPTQVVVEQSAAPIVMLNDLGWLKSVVAGAIGFGAGALIVRMI